MEQLLKESFSIRNLSRSNINSLYQRVEEKRKDNLIQSKSKSKVYSIVKQKSIENLHSLTKINETGLIGENTAHSKIILIESSTSILSHSNVKIKLMRFLKLKKE